jgi:hypothetical protein
MESRKKGLVNRLSISLWNMVKSIIVALILLYVVGAIVVFFVIWIEKCGGHGAFLTVVEQAFRWPLTFSDLFSLNPNLSFVCG